MDGAVKLKKWVQTYTRIYSYDWRHDGWYMVRREGHAWLWAGGGVECGFGVPLDIWAERQTFSGILKPNLSIRKSRAKWSLHIDMNGFLGATHSQRTRCPGVERPSISGLWLYTSAARRQRMAVGLVGKTTWSLEIAAFKWTDISTAILNAFFKGVLGRTHLEP